MNSFIIQPNKYLQQSIKAFYNSDYIGGGRWREPGTIENMICTLKNDMNYYSNNILQDKVNQLSRILMNDLPHILQQTGMNNLTVCVVPRAKVNYNPNQLLFKKTVSDIVDQLKGFSNGTNFITRHTNTKTTHSITVTFDGGNGRLPYPGITKDTCNISENIIGKDILLIDDVYTKSVNIDEDAIQALLDKGAKTLIFYAVGKTKLRSFWSIF